MHTARRACTTMSPANDMHACIMVNDYLFSRNLPFIKDDE